MMDALNLVLRSSLILAAGLVAVRLMPRSSAALRHAVLAASLFGAGLAPVLSVVMPAWPVALLPISYTAARAPDTLVVVTAEVSSTTTPTVRQDAAPAPRAGMALTIVWFAGALAGLGALAIALRRLARLTSLAEPARRDRWMRLLTESAGRSRGRQNVSVLLTGDIDVPATWGVLQPCVLLPADAESWDDDRARVVLSHELAHIRRRDWAVQLAAECLRALHWYNPLFWIACAQLRRESEFACDDRVLATGIEPSTYASYVVQFARHHASPAGRGWSGAMPMARPPALERRITVMLNPSTNRTPLSRGLSVLAVGLVAVLTVPVAAVRLHPAQTQHLAGSVYDASGAVVPEVELTLQDAAEQSLTAFTDAEGRFEFPNVAAGEYVLEAKLRGFNGLTQEFTLAEAADWDRAITLQIGTLQETIAIRAKRPPAGSTDSTAPSSGPVRVGGNIRAPKKLVDVRPVYPPSMREAGREGAVALEALVGGDGSVRSVRVLGAHVHPDFAVSAAEAVRQWRYSPTLLNGEPVEVVMNVSIAFSLEN